MKLRPIFVDVLPEFEVIKDGELWISHEHRTVNPALPVRVWGSDGAVSPPQSMARLLRWQGGLPEGSYRWVRVGQFRLRQPLPHTKQRRDLAR